MNTSILFAYWPYVGRRKARNDIRIAKYLLLNTLFHPDAIVEIFCSNLLHECHLIIECSCVVENGIRAIVMVMKSLACCSTDGPHIISRGRSIVTARIGISRSGNCCRSSARRSTAESAMLLQQPPDVRHLSFARASALLQLSSEGAIVELHAWNLFLEQRLDVFDVRFHFLVRKGQTRI